MKQAEYHCVKDSTRNVVYPIYEGSEICSHICETLGYDLNQDVDASFKKVSVIHTLGRFPFHKLIFLGLGKKEEMSSAKLRDAFSCVSAYIDEPASFAAKKAVCECADIHKVSALFMETYLLSVYEETKVNQESKVYCDVDVIAKEDVSEAITEGILMAEGINHAKDMANTPANYMTPTQLANEAKCIADQYNLGIEILDENALIEMHAGGILSVGKGSDEASKLIVLTYQGASEETPYTALIGKGITFDSGGYNLKPNSYGMKYDMCGAANVLGAIRILASLKANCNVYAIIPAAENLINGSAYKPQDVITMLSGKTVEIVSTDAEGRMLLADALTYAQRLPKVEKMIDIATLTGACFVSLGGVYSGVFANDDTFYHTFENAMKESDELGWRMPLHEEYLKMIASHSADMKNSSGKRGGGASVAACFLEQFVEKPTKWIHLDVAGSADREDKGATGVMIRSMVAVCQK